MTAQTARHILNQYYQFYTTFSPNEESIQLAHNLWKSWDMETGSNEIHEIAQRSEFIDLNLFLELTDSVRSKYNIETKIYYCPFCIQNYNFSVIPASDGFVVIVDELFYNLLFFLSVCIMHVAYTELSEYEIKNIKKYIHAIIQNNFLSNFRKRFFSDPTVFVDLMAKDYEVTESGNYLFQALKVFSLGHELGHIALHRDREMQSFQLNPHDIKSIIEINLSSHCDEFEADKFGADTLLSVIHQVDNSKATFFKYRFAFAPLLFFDICEWLIALRDGQDAPTKDSESHPSIVRRRDRLSAEFNFEAMEIYQDTKDALAILMRS